MEIRALLGQPLSGRHTLPDNFVPLTPDIGRVQAAYSRIPSLGPSPDLHRVPPSAAHLPAGTRLVCNVDMDQIATVVVQDGEAICTGGLSTCVLLAAKGTDPQGRTVIGLLHQSSEFNADDAVTAMRNAMALRGVHHYRTVVLGGELSRDAAGGGSLGDAIAIAEAAHNEGTLACGRIGVTQMSPEDVADMERPADVLPAAPGVPYKLCVVVTGDRIYYAEQGDHGPTLFDEGAVPEGATPTAELLPD